MRTVTYPLLALQVAIISLLSTETRAEILLVPDEYASIQAALDSTRNGDTVLIDPGTYHEFLVTPVGGTVFLTGTYAPDSAQDLWTLIDPIPLPEVDTPSVLRSLCDTLFVRNIAFFNRPELRQTEWPTRYGGIDNQSLHLDIADCRFDSVSGAIVGGHEIFVSESWFTGCLWANVWPSQGARVKASRCRFDGEGLWLVEAYSNSQIMNCVFTCNANRSELLKLSGENITVSECHFGPCWGGFPILRLTTQGGCVIEECIFENIERASSLIEVNMDCNDSPAVADTIRHNRFSDYSGVPPASGVRALNLQCQGQSLGNFGVIEFNLLMNGDAPSAPTAGIFSTGSLILDRNDFRNLGPSDRADVIAAGSQMNTVTARHNAFSPDGLAASTVGPVFDALFNWWGDSTGPYNAQENPAGEGAAVDGGVQFIPWLTSHPDSIADTSEVASEEPASLLANKFSLTAYPNPFNAATVLEIEVARAGEYGVELYDVTGRMVAMLYAGRIERSRMVRVDASALASGVYFARLAGGGGTKATAKMLLLK